MTPLSPIGGYAKLAAGAVVLVLVAGLCWKSYKAGQADVQADWDADKMSRSIAQAKAVDQRIEENEALRTRYAEQHQQEVNRNEAELALVHAAQQRNAGRRVSVSASICGPGTAGATQAAGSGSAQPTTAATGLVPAGTGVDPEQSGGAIYLPQPVTDRLRRLAVRADAVVADARAVQNEVKASGCF